jgi:hypothetical protein
MPIVVRSRAGAPSPSHRRGPAEQVPPPPELLLRSDGGVEPSRGPAAGREAREILAHDVGCLLAAAPDPRTADRWAADRFVLQVAAVRRHLAPIRDADLLVASFGREAFHGSGLGLVPAIGASPVRVAYAIRWIELLGGLDLPAWPAWLESCAAPR